MDNDGIPRRISVTADPNGPHIADLLENAKILRRVQAEPAVFEEKQRPRSQQDARREWVRRVFLHVWDGYKEYAWGHDELQPLSRSFRDNYNGWGATVVDNLDTLLLMNLTTEYNLAREHVRRIDFTHLTDRSIDDRFYKNVHVKPSEEHLNLTKMMETHQGWVPPGTEPSDEWAPSDLQNKIDNPPDPESWTSSTSIQEKYDYWNDRLNFLDAPRGTQITMGIPTFETIIRYVGGLVSAYELSHDELLLTKAIDLADWILPAFNTEQGLPHPRYSIGALLDSKRRMGSASLAEVGSSIMEYAKLSMITGDDKYYQAVERAMKTLRTYFIPHPQDPKRLGSLLPLAIDTSNRHILHMDYTLGAMADSYYEYLIKYYQMTGGADPDYATTFEQNIIDSQKYLIKNISGIVPGHPELLVPGDNHAGVFTARYQHLSCYVGGMMALGSRLLDRPQDFDPAQNITQTCAWTYESTPTGLGPEIVSFMEEKSFARYSVVLGNDNKTKFAIPSGRPYGVKFTDAAFHIRPETIESIFYMYRTTADPYWQDLGWTMFVDMVEHCLTDSGLAAVSDVYDPNAPKANELESFVLAETLKYYYLLFTPHDFISLDDWVFTTEAHPMRVYKPKSAPTDHTLFWDGPPKNNLFHYSSDKVYDTGTPSQKWYNVFRATISYDYWARRFDDLLEATRHIVDTSD